MRSLGGKRLILFPLVVTLRQLSAAVCLVARSAHILARSCPQRGRQYRKQQIALHIWLQQTCAGGGIAAILTGLLYVS